MRSTKPTAPHKDAVHRGGVRPDVELLKILHDRKCALIRARVGARQPAADDIHFRTGALDGDAIGHAAKREPQAACFSLLEIRSRHQWHPDILLLRKGEALGHDADHGGRNAVNPHSLAHDGRIFSVALFPEAMTQNHDRRGAGHRIRRDKITSDSRFLANQPEGIGRDLRGAAGFRKSDSYH